MTLSLGIDFGTSGARAVAINAAGAVVAQSRYQWAAGEVASTAAWQDALWHLLGELAPSIRSQISRIAINGTSATVLLCDGARQPLTEALLYNDTRGRSALEDVSAIAPAQSPVMSATSTLVKVMWLYQQRGGGANDKTAGDKTASDKIADKAADESIYITHQADFIAALLHQRPRRPVTDYHNALKLGYDVQALAYPDWLLNSPVAPWLPEVVAPGEAIAPIHPSIAQTYGLPADCQVCAGTTDSIAAFLASGAVHPGDAVTSLGSTLVLKLLSPTPIDDQAFGIYSHRFGALWLVGGASNTGGAVLQEFFDADQLRALSKKISLDIDLSQPSPFDYYPLTSPGERFPINDPDYPPRLSPRPHDDSVFLYGLLDAIARIESEGYQKLSDLGAPTLAQVYTAGGGAQNSVWQTLRQRYLDVPVCASIQTEAAYGSATLARDGLPTYEPMS